MIALRHGYHNSFFKYYLSSSFGVNSLERSMNGSALQEIPISSLRSIPIPLPPLAEQRAIAAALSDVDALLAAQDALLAKKRAVKTAAMQQLLTGAQRLPGFSGAWTTKRLGEVFDLLRTGSQSRAQLSSTGDFGYIHYGDVHGHPSSHLDLDKTVLPRINSELVATLPHIEEGDWVMVDASEDYDGVGKSYEVVNVRGRRVVAGLHTLLMRGDKTEVADGFKGYIPFIPSFRDQLVRMATGTSVYGISKTSVVDAELLLPPVDEQRAIAAVLSDMDAEIEALEAQRGKTEQVKQGMMQELLTGRTRLVPVEVA